MKILLILPLYFILLFLIPTEAMAGVFDPTVQDKSVEYLGMVFGGNIGGMHLGTSSETNAFLGNLFQVFNGIILAVAVVILSYTGAVSVLNTAHEGEVMGKKWSSVWIPLRSSMGLLLLAPIPGSGYSLIQVTVMWIVLNGIGAADRIWSMVVDNLSQGISVTQTTNINSSVNILSNAYAIAPGILQSLVCLELIKAKAADTAFLNAPAEATFTTPILTTGANPRLSGSVQFGINDPTNPVRQTICGSVPIVASVSKSELGSNVVITDAQKQQLVTNAYQVKRTALNDLIGAITTIAQVIVGITPDATGNIVLSAESNDALQSGILGNSLLHYQSAMSSLNITEAVLQAGGSFNNEVSLQQKVDESKNFGWMLAGAYYYKFSANQKAQNLLNTAINEPPKNVSCPLINGASVDSQSSLLTSVSLGTEITPSLFNPYSKALTPQSMIGLFTLPQSITVDNDFDIMTGDRAAIYSLTATLAVASPTIVIPMMAPLIIFNEAAKAALPTLLEDGDPLLNLANVGTKFMTAAEALWFAIILAGTLTTVVSAVCSAANPVGYGVLGILMFMVPLYIALASIMWTMGATMSIYLPMIPYMIFAVTALGWFISVIESIVAAPIVALGLILPSQEELGSIKHALGMVASIFLRPMLTVIGLMLSAKLFKTSMLMINTGFQASLTNIAEHARPSMFAWIAMIGLYLGFIIALVNKCYSLIYHLPDKILTWIGVNGESTDVSMVKDAKGSFDSATQQGTQVLESGAKGTAKQLEEKTGNKDKEDKDKGGDGSGLTDNTDNANKAEKTDGPGTDKPSSNAANPTSSSSGGTEAAAGATDVGGAAGGGAAAGAAGGGAAAGAAGGGAASGAAGAALIAG